MGRIAELRKRANKRFGSDPTEQSIAARGIDLAEEWADLNGFGDGDFGSLSAKKLVANKRMCKKYVKEGLYKAREEEYGFVGGLISAIVFQLIVQLVVKWIMNNFFD